jgi:hypothetical protein
MTATQMLVIRTALPRGHCEEPFDAACGVAQDKLLLRSSDEAIHY